MRTTVTLEQDVEQLLRDAMQRTRKSFKATLNQAVRRGLGGDAAAVDEEPFSVDARPMGLRAGVEPTRLNQLNDDLQVDAFLDTTQRLLERREGAP